MCICTDQSMFARPDWVNPPSSTASLLASLKGSMEKVCCGMHSGTRCILTSATTQHPHPQYTCTLPADSLTVPRRGAVSIRTSNSQSRIQTLRRQTQLQQHLHPPFRPPLLVQLGRSGAARVCASCVQRLRRPSRGELRVSIEQSMRIFKCGVY